MQTFLRENTLPGLIRQLRKKHKGNLKAQLEYISQDEDGWKADLVELVKMEKLRYDTPYRVKQSNLFVEVIREKQRPPPCPHKLKLTQLTPQEVEFHYLEYTIRIGGVGENAA